MENIKSYAFENNEWQWCKEKYTESLNNEVFGIKKRRYSCGSIYCDPDEGNKEYYSQITLFLNAQEEKRVLKGKRFNYCVGNYISCDNYLEEMDKPSKKNVKNCFWNIEFEKMFNKLCKKVNERTMKMNEVIQEWVQNQSYR